MSAAARFLLMGSNSYVPPVAPVWGGATSRSSTTTPSTSNTITFQFGVTYRSGTISSSSGGADSTFTYFASSVASHQINAADYEVFVTTATGISGHNYSKNGGESPLGSWVSLDTDPKFSWTCSGRRGGVMDVTIQMRHKVETSLSATRVFSLSQTSDAVSPTFGGNSTASLTISSSQTMTQGVYIDDGSSANAGRIRNYRDGTLVDNTGWTFDTGGISESEYSMLSFPGGVSPSGIATFSGTSSTGQSIGTLRTNPASQTSGPRAVGSGSSGSGTATIVITIRHSLDQQKSSTRNFTFTKNVT